MISTCSSYLWKCDNNVVNLSYSFQVAITNTAITKSDLDYFTGNNMDAEAGLQGKNIRRETDSISVDKKYFTSKHGIIKEGAMVLALLGFITSFFGYNSSSASVIFYAVITILAFWVVAIQFAITATGAIPPSNFAFLAIQVVSNGTWTIFLMLASIIIVTNGGIYMLPAFLGFGSMFFCSFDAFYLMYTYSQQTRVNPDAK